MHNVFTHLDSPLERGCDGVCSGGGVLADMIVNTPTPYLSREESHSPPLQRYLK